MGLICIAAFPGWCIGRFQRPMYPRLSPHIEVPLLPNLVGRIGRGLRIERLPPSLSIGCAPLRDVDRRPVHQGLEPGGIAIGHSRAHDGAAATKSFRIDIGIFFADARLRERTHDPAGETAGSGAGEGRCRF